MGVWMSWEDLPNKSSELFLNMQYWHIYLLCTFYLQLIFCSVYTLVHCYSGLSYRGKPVNCADTNKPSGSNSSQKQFITSHSLSVLTWDRGIERPQSSVIPHLWSSWSTISGYRLASPTTKKLVTGMSDFGNLRAQRDARTRVYRTAEVRMHGGLLKTMSRCRNQTARHANKPPRDWPRLPTNRGYQQSHIKL